MKKFLLFFSLSVCTILGASATITIDEVVYKADTLIHKQIGPGVVYTRIRIPDYPLNLNITKTDLNNEYNKVETTVAYETLGSTETLANAYNRQVEAGNYPLAAVNANFWCTTESPYSDYMKGTPFGGSLKNGQILTETNGYSNPWNGGGANTGAAAIDINKKMWVESMTWTGSVTSSKWDAAEAICESNKIANENELAMFNSYFGTTREFNTTDDNLNIFLDLKEGEEWATGKSFVVVVKECAMNTAKNTLGDYDLCLSYRGTNIAKYEEIAVGDELTIKYAWKSCATSDEPELTQLVSGNAMVLFNGELTDRNYNESYNTTVYSRTGYGMSEDGKTLFNIVIDKSTDAVYGTSAGCSTAVMGQIMQQLGCWNLTTMDAGGSAQMLIEGEVINKTTEGTPRAVANGWMLFSTAPRDTEIAEIKFADYDVTLPIYSSYKPLVYGYNQYGDLVNEDLQGIILSCDEQVGYINGDLFNASSAAATGELTISYNGIEASKMVTVVDGAMSFRVENIIIDKLREYPIEVLADCGDGEEYICDPARFQWSIEDESIVSIDEDGVLRGLMVGNTTISGALDEFNGSANVSVEIPSDDKLYQGFEDWTITGSGASSFSLNGDGELSFTYSSGRNPYITMSKEIDLYSLPERVVLDFTSTLPFSSVLIDCRTAEMTYSNYITYSEDDDYAAGENHKLVIELSEICDIEDLLMFPISLHAIKLNVGSGATTGDNTITINGLYAEYAEGSSGVVAVMGDKDAKVSIYPNPVEDGIMMISSSDVNMAKVDIYNLSGGLVKSVNLVINGGCATVDVSNLTPNMYIVKVSDGLVNEVNKVIIK